jgi:hypothetical protein
MDNNTQEVRKYFYPEQSADLENEIAILKRGGGAKQWIVVPNQRLQHPSSLFYNE